MNNTTEVFNAIDQSGYKGGYQTENTIAGAVMILLAFVFIYFLFIRKSND